MKNRSKTAALAVTVVISAAAPFLPPPGVEPDVEPREPTGDHARLLDRDALTPKAPAKLRGVATAKVETLIAAPGEVTTPFEVAVAIREEPEPQS